MRRFQNEGKDHGIIISCAACIQQSNTVNADFETSRGRDEEGRKSERWQKSNLRKGHDRERGGEANGVNCRAVSPRSRTVSACTTTRREEARDGQGADAPEVRPPPLREQARDGARCRGQGREGKGRQDSVWSAALLALYSTQLSSLFWFSLVSTSLCFTASPAKYRPRQSLSEGSSTFRQIRSQSTSWQDLKLLTKSWHSSFDAKVWRLYPPSSKVT